MLSEIKFSLTAGFPDWDKITAAQLLLSEAVETNNNADILLLGCGHGALAVFLSRQIHNGQLLLSDTNTIALSTAQKTLNMNNITNAEIISAITLIPKYHEKFDVIVADINLSKGRGFSRRWLIEACEALKTGGRLYLAGAKKHGIKSVIKDTKELFGNIKILGYKKGNRVVGAIKKSSQRKNICWNKEAGIALGTWHKIKTKLRDEPFCFYSLPGIFSHKEIDEGTKKLLDNIDNFEDKKILDWGCGYGVIGIFLAKFGASNVDMVDIDTFALASACKNIDANKVCNVRVSSVNDSDFVKNKTYDLIVSNPPFHIGKDTDCRITISFIQQAKKALNPGGRLVIVANKFIPYEKHMEKFFKRIRYIFEDSKYKVIETG